MEFYGSSMDMNINRIAVAIPYGKCVCTCGSITQLNACTSGVYTRKL